MITAVMVIWVAVTEVRHMSGSEVFKQNSSVVPMGQAVDPEKIKAEDNIIAV